MSDGGTLTFREAFDIYDDSGPMTLEMWKSLEAKMSRRTSAGIARRLAVISSDLTAIGNALEGEGSTVLKRALREHGSELLEVMEWLTPRELDGKG